MAKTTEPRLCVSTQPCPNQAARQPIAKKIEDQYLHDIVINRVFTPVT